MLSMFLRTLDSQKASCGGQNSFLLSEPMAKSRPSIGPKPLELTTQSQSLNSGAGTRLSPGANGKPGREDVWLLICFRGRDMFPRT